MTPFYIVWLILDQDIITVGMSKHVAYINDRSIKIIIYDFTNSRLFRDFGVTQLVMWPIFFVIFGVFSG